MKHTDTICYKVEKCMELLEQAVATQNLDVAGMNKMLSEIRKNAQNMEDGLKTRKTIMSQAGLEEEYQTIKGKRQADSYVRSEMTEGKQDFEISVSQNGIHQFTRKAHGFVLSIAERIDELDEVGSITGESEILMSGHPLAIFYSFDQLRIKIEEKRFEFLNAIREAAQKSKYLKPEYKKKIQEMTNL